MKTTYIYGIRCLEVDKYIYVGKANDIGVRFKDHLRHSHNDCVYEWIEEKGEENFDAKVLEEVAFEISEDWIERESFWIAKLEDEGHPLCNRNNGGSGPTELSEETKLLLGKKSKKWHATHIHPMLGKHHTTETIDKISFALSGEGNPMYGKEGQWKGKKGTEHPMYGHQPSEEWRCEHSKRMTGKGNPMYGIDRSGKKNTFYGKHHTEETKDKLSKANLGDNNPRGMLGRHHTEEAKAKVGKANAKPYPAFYNNKTGVFIPSGRNLRKMCDSYNLDYNHMAYVKGAYLDRNPSESSRDGWRLATESEIANMAGAGGGAMF